MYLGGFGISYNYINSTSNNTNPFGVVLNNGDSRTYDLSVFGSITNFSGIGAYYLF